MQSLLPDINIHFVSLSPRSLPFLILLRASSRFSFGVLPPALAGLATEDDTLAGVVLAGDDGSGGGAGGAAEDAAGADWNR